MGLTDPFTSAPEDEAQTEAPQEPAEEPTPEPAKPAKKKPVATVKVKPEFEGFDGGKITVTFKGGASFDSPWIVVHAADIQDAYDQVTGDNAVLLSKLMERVSVAGQHFAGLAPRPAPTQQQATSAAPPAAAQQAPGGERRYCNHGEMRFKSDVSKAGKAYSGFFCPERDRNAQCKAQFL